MCYITQQSAVLHCAQNQQISKRKWFKHAKHDEAGSAYCNSCSTFSHRRAVLTPCYYVPAFLFGVVPPLSDTCISIAVMLSVKTAHENAKGVFNLEARCEALCTATCRARWHQICDLLARGLSNEQGRQSVYNIVRVQSPSLPFPSHRLSFPLFHSLPLSLFSFSLRSSLLNPARGSGERCKLPQWGLERSHSRQRFSAFWGWRKKLLVAFKMHGFKRQKTAFPYIFMKKFSKS